MAKINIDRITIRHSGNATRYHQSFIAGIGEGLLLHLSRQQAVVRQGGSRLIDEVNPDAIRLTGRETPRHVQQKIIDAIGNAVTSHTSGLSQGSKS